MIYVYYTHFSTPFDEMIYQEYLNKLPEFIRLQISKYRFWQDAHATLLGKLLLAKALEDHFKDQYTLGDIKYLNHNKPHIHESFDFNISHSGDYVICALSHEGKIGIDIEKIKPINYVEFKRVFRDDELKDIHESEQPYEKFFDYWTKKEAVIKADSRGMTIPLKDIFLEENDATVFNCTWFLRELYIDSNYKCNLASEIFAPYILQEVIF